MTSFFVSDVELNHFKPTLLWPRNYSTQKSGRSILDETSKHYYLNDSRFVIRFKLFLLATFCVPIIHVSFAAIQIIASMFKMLLNLSKILTDRENSSLHAYNALKDLIKIILAPLLVIALEISAIIGLIFPLNARKIFGSIERFMVNEFEAHSCYNKTIIQEEILENKGLSAPCFQPKTRGDEPPKDQTNIHNPSYN